MNPSQLINDVQALWATMLALATCAACIGIPLVLALLLIRERKH